MSQEKKEEGRENAPRRRKNKEMLCESVTWFMAEAFKISPAIFTQIFTVIRSHKRINGYEESVPLPLVYALLSGKTIAFELRRPVSSWKYCRREQN